MRTFLIRAQYKTHTGGLWIHTAVEVQLDVDSIVRTAAGKRLADDAGAVEVEIKSVEEVSNG